MRKILLATTCFLLATCVYVSGQTGIRAPDTTVNAVLKLMTPASIRKVLGDQSKRLIDDDKGTWVRLISKDGSEYLILYQLPGSSYNTFNEFEIGVYAKKAKGSYATTFVSFGTEAGIHLGVSMDSLIKTKGGGFVRTKKGDQIVLTYKMKGKQSILERYNMPEYEATYYFSNDKLVRFRFGFPNP